MAKQEVLYGWHAAQSFLETQPELVVCLWLQQGRADARAESMSALALQHGIAIQRIAKEKLTRMVHHEHHQGVVLTIKPSVKLGEDDLLALVQQKYQPLLLVLDQVLDPHNVGACIRTAAAMGADGVVLPRDHSAPLSATVRKTAAGALEHIALFQVTNLARSLDMLQKQGVRIIGTLLDETAQPLPSCDLTGAIAVVLGSEETGLRTLTQRYCDVRTYIPMLGQIQSLNVSVACAMVLYEAFKQRVSSG